jgi:hypothetical protein
VETQLATRLPAESVRSGARVRTIALIGPLTVVAGMVWAILQPYRITLLHPRGQGFWWLAIQPPLLVVAVGIVFALAVARPLIADLEERHDSA